MISHLLKQKRRKFYVILLFISFGLSKDSYGWGNKKTHPTLTYEATQTNNNSAKLDDYLKTQLELKEGLYTELEWDFPSDIKERIKWGKVEPDKTNRTISDWLKVGSTIEDEDGHWQPIRPRHHFYDPCRNSGLDNQTDHPNWRNYMCTWTGFDLTGESALWWAKKGYDRGNRTPRYNENYWWSAREDFRRALVLEGKKYRELNLASMFLNLGCVLHLIEDMGVPAHSRNDFIEAHYRGIKSPLNFKDNPLERHVEGEIENLGAIPARWLEGWMPQAKVYSKLAHYWDTNSYTGQPAGTSPPSNWGLSERTNYQFLSKSTIFRENDGTLYYFPHPNANNVTGYIEPGVYTWNSIPVHYRYISGYDISHLARTKYIEKYAYAAGMQYPVHTGTVVYHTTFDNFVIEDYAKVTIPRTIDYVTGLTNYFFRGRLSVEPNWADPNIAVLIITNDSNNSGVAQALKGGEFKLYWDNIDGNRAEVNNLVIVSGWGPSSVLEYDCNVTATFTKEVNAAAYILVYQGQISENPDEPDTDDPNAIAVIVFRPGYPIIAWGDHNSYGQIGDAPDGNEFIAVAAGNAHCIALKSDGSLVGWGYNVHNECNVPAGNNYVDISAGFHHSMALTSDGSIVVWGRDNLHQITDKPDGNDFVAITAGDWHSLAIKRDGTIVGWGGWNDFGECDAPPPDTGTTYIDIAAGSFHSLALQSDGKVKAWGNNNLGQTTIYGSAAGKVHTAVAAGGNYNFLLREDDYLISWGGGDWLDELLREPRYHYRYPDGNDFTVIAAGSDHIMALTSDGKAFDWNWPYGDYPFYYFDRHDVPSDVVFVRDIDGGYDFSVSLRLP
jgi:hypothetical protein